MLQLRQLLPQRQATIVYAGGDPTVHGVMLQEGLLLGALRQHPQFAWVQRDAKTWAGALVRLAVAIATAGE